MEQSPPMHGVTYINKILFDNLKDESKYSFYNINYNLHANEVGNISVKKVFHNLKIIFGAWKCFFIFYPDKIYTPLSATFYGIFRDFLMNIPAIIFRRKIILHLHGFTYYKMYQTSKAYKLLFTLISKNSELVVLCKEQKIKTLDIMSRNSEILSNCLRKDCDHGFKVKNEKIQICYISNISRQKGVFELVKAVQLYGDGIKLVVAGNFLSDKSDFFNLISGSENISYLGFADEQLKNRILQDSDIFCLPSKLEEGSPVSIVEAMSYGMPIIASDKGCIKEMIRGTGYVLPNNYKVTDICIALQCVMDNYKDFSRKASEEYKSGYSRKKFLKNFESIIQG